MEKRLFLEVRNEEKLKLVAYQMTGDIIIDTVSTQKPEKQKNSVLNKIAISLITLSFVLFGMIFVVPFISFTLAQKSIIIPLLIVSSEIIWWIGLAIIGKQAVTKCKKYLNPCNWFYCKKNIPENSNCE